MLLPPLTPPSVTVTPWQLPTQQLANLYERANEDHYALVAGVQSCFLGGASDAMSQSMHGLPVSFAHVAAMAAVRIALAVLSHHLSCSLMLCPFIGDSYTPLADSARPSLPQSAMVLSGMLGALWLRSLEEAIPGTSIDKVGRDSCAGMHICVCVCIDMRTYTYIQVVAKTGCDYLFCATLSNSAYLA